MKETNKEKKNTHYFAPWLFLRLLGVIYLIAFVSLMVQITGLAGSNGILPAQKFLEAIAKNTGMERFFLLPTLGWINAGDAFLQGLCAFGAFFSILLILDIAPALVCFMLWLAYLSLVNLCQDFLGFQWDILLLETGFLAIFLSPLTLIPKFPLAKRGEPSKIVLWLYCWLLFRLMFSSGVVKLSSGDPSWRALTALNFHYETQPLPHWISWFMHQLPASFQKFSTIGMFVCELIIPFFIFAPQKIRSLAALVLIGLQLTIFMTGNYCFFNLLAIALCIPMLDDGFFSKAIHKLTGAGNSPKQKQESVFWPQGVTIPIAILIGILSIIPLVSVFRIRVLLPKPLFAVYSMSQPFYLVNSYGLFAVMTTTRQEIINQYSDYKQNWKDN